jgi:hypothetical protein
MVSGLKSKDYSDRIKELKMVTLSVSQERRAGHDRNIQDSYRKKCCELFCLV